MVTKLSTTVDLYDLWIEHGLEEAQEDIEERNKSLGWTPPVPVPATVEEARVAYRDQRVVAYVKREAADRKARFQQQIERLEREAQAVLVVDQEQTRWYRREIKALRTLNALFDRILAHEDL
jgi:hypothetical protein